MIRAMRQQLPESSLSIWTLATQMILFLLLGISYIVRLGKRGTGFNKPLNVPMDLYTWYRLVGWPYVNNIIYGIGQGVLFFMYLYYLHVDRIQAVISVSNREADGRPSVRFSYRWFSIDTYVDSGCNFNQVTYEQGPAIYIRLHINHVSQRMEIVLESCFSGQPASKRLTTSSPLRTDNSQRFQRRS
jgi:hypothetical protein